MEQSLFMFASWVGGAAFALSGFLIGVRKDMDIMGVFILSFLTANGGGLLRDLMTGRVPLALTDLAAFWLVILVFAAGMSLHYMKRVDIEKMNVFVVSDSIGLVAFSVTGALVGIEAGLSIFGVMVLSFLTATGGGIIRDILVNDVPLIFTSDFYGSVALLVGAVLYGLFAMGWMSQHAIMGVFAAALILRLAAFRFGWHLPKVTL